VGPPGGLPGRDRLLLGRICSVLAVLFVGAWVRARRAARPRVWGPDDQQQGRAAGPGAGLPREHAQLGPPKGEALKTHAVAIGFTTPLYLLPPSTHGGMIGVTSGTSTHTPANGQWLPIAAIG